MKFFIIFLFSLIGLLESRKKKLGGTSKIVSSYSFGKHFLKSFNGVVLNHHGYVKNQKSWEEIDQKFGSYYLKTFFNSYDEQFIMDDLKNGYKSDKCGDPRYNSKTYETSKRYAIMQFEKVGNSYFLRFSSFCKISICVIEKGKTMFANHLLRTIC